MEDKFWRMLPPDRDKEIIRLYVEDKMLPRKIADMTNLSAARIWQILDVAGVREGNRIKPMYGERHMTGMLLTRKMKDVIKEQAKLERKSLSQFCVEIIETELKSRGVEIPQTPIDRGDPLPFEIVDD